MKAKAVGVGVLAWFAYGIVLALVEMFVFPDVSVVWSTVVFAMGVATGVAWYRKRRSEPGESPQT